MPVTLTVAEQVAFGTCGSRMTPPGLQGEAAAETQGSHALPQTLQPAPAPPHHPRRCVGPTYPKPYDSSGLHSCPEC